MRDGFTAIPNVLLRSRMLSGQAKILYAIILDVVVYRREEPTMVQLGDLMGCGVKVVRGAMAELVAAGYAESKRRGQGLPNRVYLTVPEAQSDQNGQSASSETDTLSVLVKTVKDKSARADQPERPKDPLWDALVEVFGKAPAGIERGRWNVAAKSLREAGATAEQVAEAAEAYRTHATFRDCVLTPTALAANWTILTGVPKTAADFAADRVHDYVAEREARWAAYDEGGTQ
jgi:hypothetical protein